MASSERDRMLVVGAGTMGHGLAQVFASGGYDVQLVDVSASILGRALRQIRSNLEMMAEAEALDRTEIDPILERIGTSTDLEASARDVDLALEAVPEDPEVKRDLFVRLAEACPADTILLSNTSSLNLFEIVRIRNPERFCIAHWYAPPYIIPLVDVVKGPETSDDTADRVARLLTRLGKKPVVLDRFIQGYLVNRLQVAIGREVNDLLDRGLATPEQLDEAVKASLAPRMVVVGVAQRYDFTGLDVSLAIQKEMAKRLSAMPAYSTMQRLVDAGHMGVKTGKGFYDYDGKTPRQILKARDLALLKIFKQTAGGGLDRT